MEGVNIIKKEKPESNCRFLNGYLKNYYFYIGLKAYEIPFNEDRKIFSFFDLPLFSRHR
jgi:hypothetical protein